MCLVGRHRDGYLANRLPLLTGSGSQKHGQNTCPLWEHTVPVYYHNCFFWIPPKRSAGPEMQAKGDQIYNKEAKTTRSGPNTLRLTKPAPAVWLLWVICQKLTQKKLHTHPLMKYSHPPPPRTTHDQSENQRLHIVLYAL